jgi:hypothetical protein
MKVPSSFFEKQASFLIALLFISSLIKLRSPILLIYNGYSTRGARAALCSPITFLMGHLTPLSRYSDGLQAGRTGFHYRQVQDIFSLLHSVQTVSGANLVSYPMGIWAKRHVREADHLHQYISEVKNGGALPPQYLHGVVLN